MSGATEQLAGSPSCFGARCGTRKLDSGMPGLEPRASSAGEASQPRECHGTDRPWAVFLGFALRGRQQGCPTCNFAAHKAIERRRIALGFLRNCAAELGQALAYDRLIERLVEGVGELAN